MTTKTARRQAWRRGWVAESLCVASLICRGYRILARRLRSPVGEIDIVAQRGGILAIIEVKARPTHAQALESVTRRQQDRLVRAAQWYIASRPTLAALALRFDVMVVAPRRAPRHLTDAWRPGLG
jgi:putative endonuclease